MGKPTRRDSIAIGACALRKVRRRLIPFMFLLYVVRPSTGSTSGSPRSR